MKEIWTYLDTGFHDAAINMALDESLLNWHSEGRIPPTLRMYGWSKPSLSIGRFQSIKPIDFAALEHHKCQFVRRLTGGSAVLHDNELTYSITVSENHPNIPGSIKEAYYHLSKGLLEGYANLGIYAEHTSTKGKLDKGSAAVCFEKTAFYELVVDGKKISGNAQTRKDGVLLQHGSIPITIDEKMLFDLFLFPSEEARKRKRLEFFKKASAIQRLTDKQHTFDEIKTAFLDGFAIGLNISLKPMTLSQNQWREVHELASKKYASSSIAEGVEMR
ncbi:lipoate--protein ligase family protein [Virgibacillus indicus]|nr:lipoate--protein ligase family protein [Virgibacillus indicus]